MSKKKVRKKPLALDPEIATHTDLQIHSNEINAVKRKIERQREILLACDSTKKEIKEDLTELETEKGNEIRQLRLEVDAARKLKLQRKTEKKILENSLETDKADFEETLVKINVETEEIVEKLTKEVTLVRDKVATLRDFKANNIKMHQQIAQSYEDLQKIKEEHHKKIELLRKQRATNCLTVKRLAEQQIAKLREELAKMRKQYAMETDPELMREFEFINDTALYMEDKIKKSRLSAFREQVKLNFLKHKKECVKKEIEYLIKNYFDRYLRYDELEIVDEMVKAKRTTAINKSTLEDSLGVNEEVLQNLEPVRESRVGEVFEYIEIPCQELEYELRAIMKAIRKLAEEALAINLVPLGELAEESKLTDTDNLNRYKRRRERAFNKRGDILEMMLLVMSHGLDSSRFEKLSTVNAVETAEVDFEGSTVLDVSIRDTHKRSTHFSSKIMTPSSSSGSLPRSPSYFYMQPEGDHVYDGTSVTSALSYRNLIADYSQQLLGEDEEAE